MPVMDGLELMQRALRIDRDLPGDLISGHADVATAVNAMRQAEAMIYSKNRFTTAQLLGSSQTSAGKNAA